MGFGSLLVLRFSLFLSAKRLSFACGLSTATRQQRRIPSLSALYARWQIERKAKRVRFSRFLNCPFKGAPVLFLVECWYSTIAAQQGISRYFDGFAGFYGYVFGLAFVGQAKLSGGVGACENLGFRQCAVAPSCVDGVVAACAQSGETSRRIKQP